MENITAGSLLISLWVILIQDWKYRRIHIVLPLVIFLSSLYQTRKFHQVTATLLLFNLSFVVFCITIMSIYMSLKAKQWKNPFDHFFGLGDLLFYLAVAPLFAPYHFMIFFILSLIFAVFSQKLTEKWMTEKTVPLAGFSALLTFFIILNDMIFGFTKLTLL